jgi:hypothetical protein
MNTYTDPRIFDLAGAVEKLPALAAAPTAAVAATGTHGPSSGRSESVSSQSTGIGCCSAETGGIAVRDGMPLTLVGGGNWQQKTPSGRDGAKERVKGVEPSTFTLATRQNGTPKSSKMPVFTGFYHAPRRFSSLFKLSRF